MSAYAKFMMSVFVGGSWRMEPGTDSLTELQSMVSTAIAENGAENVRTWVMVPIPLDPGAMTEELEHHDILLDNLSAQDARVEGELERLTRRGFEIPDNSADHV